MKKITTLKKNRICKFSKCTNMLSIYNNNTFCYVHQRTMNDLAVKTNVAFKTKRMAS
jgi:hypothetical protein